MKTLVLGAAGFLGANLVRALLAKGEEVRIFVRPTSKLRALKGLNVDLECIVGDLMDPGSLERACRGARVVYQTASYYPPHTIPVEVARQRALAETRQLLNAVRWADVDRLVFTSTLTTIGFPPAGSQRLANEDDSFVSLFPHNPYLIAKVAMEREVMDAAHRGVPAVVVNPTAFFGPYDSKPTSGTQILLIARRMMPAYVQGNVNAIDVRDVADGMISAADRGRVGERYILGRWNTTQKELNALIARVAGVPAPFVPVPFSLARIGTRCSDHVFQWLGKAAPVPGFFVEMLRHMQQYDCSKATRELGPPQRSIETAVRDELQWFTENGYLPKRRTSGST